MRPARHFISYLKTSTGRVSAAIVLACALVLAYFIGRTFVSPLPRQYRLDFGAAHWIQRAGAKSTDADYFRKSLYMTGPVKRAWVEIAVTGYYQLYVNNIVVDQGTFPCVRLTGVYDLTWLLSHGKNAIAIYLQGGRFPGPNQIRVRGFYQVAGSPVQEVVSDSTWQVSATPDGLLGSYLWASPQLDARLWTNAQEVEAGERFSTVQAVSMDPRLFQIPPSAKWIIARPSGARQVSFLTSLHLPLRRGETWIEAAATGAYDLLVNGRLAAAQPIAPQTALAGPYAPVQTAPGAGIPSYLKPFVVT